MLVLSCVVFLFSEECLSLRKRQEVQERPSYVAKSGLYWREGGHECNPDEGSRDDSRQGTTDACV